jgi:hypothetical protein
MSPAAYQAHGRTLLVDAALGAGAYTYPSAAGLAVKGKTVFELLASIANANGVLTIEGTLDAATDSGTAVWVDITRSFKSIRLATDGAASYSNVSTILLLNGVPLERIRFVMTVAGACQTKLRLWVG